MASRNLTGPLKMASCLAAALALGVSLYWVLQHAEVRTQPLIAAWVFAAIAFVLTMRAASDPSGNSRRGSLWIFGASAACFAVGLLNAMR